MGFLEKAAAFLGLGAGRAPALPHAAPYRDSIVVRSIPEEAPARRPDGLTTAPLRIQTEWLLGEIAMAMAAADGGNLRPAALLCEASRQDGRVAGLMATRTRGLISLPYSIVQEGRQGKPYVTDDEGDDFAKIVTQGYNRVCRSTEVEAWLSDAVQLGVAAGQFINEEEGSDNPLGFRFVRLLPEHIWINAVTGQAHYLGETITPGDGRWIYYAATTQAPWRRGLWIAIARAFVVKDHAYFLQEGYANKLANPAVAAIAKAGANWEDFQRHLNQVAAWSPNSTFALKDGFDIKIIEANGQGTQVFRNQKEDANEDLTLVICGQLGTTGGGGAGTGFINMEFFQAIRKDIITGDQRILEETFNRQVVPWIQRDLARTIEQEQATLCLYYDSRSPDERRAEENEEKAQYETEQKKLEVLEIAKNLGADISPNLQAMGYKLPASAASSYGYEIDAGFMTLNEVRQSKGLPPLPGGDELLSKIQADADKNAEEARVIRRLASLIRESKRPENA